MVGNVVLPFNARLDTSSRAIAGGEEESSDINLLAADIAEMRTASIVASNSNNNNVTVI